MQAEGEVRSITNANINSLLIEVSGCVALASNASIKPAQATSRNTDLHDFCDTYKVTDALFTRLSLY